MAGPAENDFNAAGREMQVVWDNTAFRKYFLYRFVWQPSKFTPDDQKLFRVCAGQLHPRRIGRRSVADPLPLDDISLDGSARLLSESIYTSAIPCPL